MHAFTALLALAVSVVSAAPAPQGPVENVAFAPKIIEPTPGSIWAVNSTQTVVWLTSDMPDEVKNSTGTLLLGYLDDNSTSEHLDIAHPLASGFSMGAGNVTIGSVPNVTTGDNYVVALIGDSGDISGKFTITQPQSQ